MALQMPYSLTLQLCRSSALEGGLALEWSKRCRFGSRGGTWEGRLVSTGGRGKGVGVGVGVGLGDVTTWKSQHEVDLRGRAVAKLGPWSRSAKSSTLCLGLDHTVSSGEDFEGISQGGQAYQATNELLEPRGVSSSGSRMTSFSKSMIKMFSFGNYCQSSCPESRGVWRKIPAGLLCSCAVVTPGLASSIGAVEAVPALDFVAAAVTLAGALGILQFFDELAKRDIVEKKLSRKLVHILSGLVFMLFWPLFSSAPPAKYMAAFAPAANGLRMIGLGLGLWRNEALVKAISREGSQRELLKGPFYYALTITIVTLFFWRSSPVGAVAVANLCAGDGFADIVGRKYGTHKLPYNSSKSYVGSIAFVVLASLASMGYVAYFAAFGFITATTKVYLATIGVSLASAIAESLPIPVDDNFTVPFTAIGVGMLLMPF